MPLVGVRRGTKNMKIETVIGVVFGVLCAVLGVVFRPFWLSPVGAYAFLLFVWISTSVGMGWGGRGKPYSLRFGFICGTAFAAICAIALFFNAYAGLAVFAALFVAGHKSGFFKQRSDQLKA